MMGPEDSEETDLTEIEKRVEELWEIGKVDYSYGWLKARQARMSSVWRATEGLRRVTLQDD